MLSELNHRKTHCLVYEQPWMNSSQTVEAQRWVPGAVEGCRELCASWGRCQLEMVETFCGWKVEGMKVLVDNALRIF